LLTPFTSFVAVSHTVRHLGAAAENVDQPSPLPQGVSNSAVGEPMQSADEPELWLVVALLGAFAGIAALRARRRELAA
jgi:Ca-activated chloride channel family protein